MERKSIGDRMKGYERCATPALPRRVPVIIRVDGKAFHTLTRRVFGRGWSQEFTNMMSITALVGQKEIQGCDFCYIQSDEISFLLTDYRTINTEAWFANEVVKMVSVSAGIVSADFSLRVGRPAVFDSRAFSVPQDDVCNYFIWRQQDATRNAIQMAGQEHFSPKELHGKSCAAIQEMLFTQKGVNFNDYPVMRRRGIVIRSGLLDYEIPIFSQDRAYVEAFVDVRTD